ncbi:unnamed protein product [Cuscuta campestris]|uniref:Uncharacterized protein n=1 Tax=Cuscuta campestris TaxID=132261 RepID=A0A484KAA5_9ASTE|nr:unnamed protein product [Cuscuta campestris]
MSHSWGKLPRCSISSISRQQSFISSPFSTSAGGSGGGWGRGRGGGGFSSGNSPAFGFSPNQSEPGDAKDEESASTRKQSGFGHGRGSGKPLFSFVGDYNGPAGRGRGISGPTSAPPPPQPSHQVPLQHRDSYNPMFSVKEEGFLESQPKASVDSSDAPRLPANILSVLSGVGRGTTKQTAPVREKPKEENRHLRARQTPQSGGNEASRRPGQGFSSRDDPNNRSVSSGGGDGSGRGGVASWRGRGGFRDRGRGGRRGGRGGRGRGEGALQEVVHEKFGGVFDIGDDAATEKLVQQFGPDLASQLAEGVEEFAHRVFPSPAEDAYLDALDTNLKIECEEEYMMGDFDKNPDIDEKPPISLRDALEKMKPFLMAYEGIESQKEWEEIMKDTMEVKLPLLKEIVDHYSGPDRVTAKQQHQELKRVAATLPQSIPNSVKQFTDRAVQSLQSNPGWGFHNKCQFMDKLAYEVTRQYK